MNRKKFVALTILLISFALMLGGCLSNQSNIENHNEYDNGYRDGYNDGYRDGYDDGKEVGIDESYHESYEEEYLEFQSTIITLMYDYEYETVEKLLEYYPEAVSPALENEFGTDNLSTIIEYLENIRKEQPITIVGICRYCNEDVYSDDVVYMTSLHEPSEISYAHKKCFNENNTDEDN